MLISYPDKFQDPSKPVLKFDFSDFGFINKINNFFVDVLSKEYNVVISDKPDLLFYSDTGGSQLHRLYTCKKIFWTGESTHPNFNHADGALTPLFLNDERHMRLPYYIIGTECDWQDLIKKDNEHLETLSEQRDGITAVISNVGKKAQLRTDFYDAISKRCHVFSGGKALNNIGGPIPPGGNAKYKFLSKHKFNIAFENKSLPGYATEKLVEAMWARAIPIYFGDPTISNDFNPKSFINISDFESFDTAIDYIIEVDRTDSLYEKYLSEPYFIDNKPNYWFDTTIYLNFIKKIINQPSRTKTIRKTFGRWTIAKRMH